MLGAAQSRALLLPPSLPQSDIGGSHMLPMQEDFEKDPKYDQGTRSQKGLEDKKPYTFNKRETQIMRL